MKPALTALIALAVSAACTGTESAVASASASERRAEAVHAPGYVVDSALPPAELLRRFRVGLDSVARFDNGAASTRDALVQRFARALTRHDTSALRALALSRAEFAYLYYPGTQYVRPPYLIAPDVLWQLMHARSESGMKRLVARVGDAGVRIQGAVCERAPAVEGRNRLLRECVVRVRRAGADSVERRRLFGTIVERDGRYKFVSYANDF